MKISRLILITFIIISIIFVCSNGAALNAKSQNRADDEMQNEIRKVLRATLFHDSHPSVNGGMREVATCITEEALDAAMEGVVIKSYHGFKQNATVQLRNKICKENKELISTFIFCLIHSQTEQFRDFLTALSITSEFLIDEFCQSPDISRFPYLIDESHYRRLKSDDLCSSIQVAESIEVMAILSRKFPFFLHGAIGNLYHLITTINIIECL